MSVKSKARNAIWVDDDHGSISPFAQLFEERGYQVVPVLPENYDQKSIAMADLVLLDLENGFASDGRINENGLRLARRTNLVAPSKPIVIVSRYLAQPEWEHLSRQLNPTARMAEISKRTLARAAKKDHTDYKAEAISAAATLDEVLEGLEHEKSLPVAEFGEIGNFPVSDFESFFALARSERSSLILQANRQLEIQLDSVFNSQEDVSWIVLNLPSGEPLLWGATGSEPPRSIQKLRRLATLALIPGVPVTFHRPRFIDI